MSINKNELTKEQIQKAMACKTVEELMELAKAEGVELTKDVELDSDALKNVAGGVCYMAACNDDCSAKTPTLLGGNPY